MSDYERRELTHYKKLAELGADFSGRIGALLEMQDEGQMTPQQLVDRLREVSAEYQAARRTAWNVHTGGDR